MKAIQVKAAELDTFTLRIARIHVKTQVATGMKHSKMGSVAAKFAPAFDLPKSAGPEKVLAAIEAELAKR